MKGLICKDQPFKILKFWLEISREYLEKREQNTLDYSKFKFDYIFDNDYSNEKLDFIVNNILKEL